jgi:cold shock CspA family protein
MNVEYLDYCRVKKIFEKGFGFLSSIYFEENVFFHFSKIKDRDTKEKLEKLKRGAVYLFYTSKNEQGKRKVDKIWLDINDVDPKLIPSFTIRIIEELNGSKINIFELAHVVYLLREAGSINRSQFEKVLCSVTLKRIPSSIIKMLSQSEVKLFKDFNKLIDDVGRGRMSYKELTELVLEKVY